MEKLLKFLNRMDWTLAVAAVGYGLFISNVWVVAAGVGGLAVAWYNPSQRVQQWLKSKMLASPKRRSEAEAQAAAQRIARIEAEYAANEALASPPADYRVQLSGYAGMTIRPNKHNLLTPGCTNLIKRPKTTWH